MRALGLAIFGVILFIGVVAEYAWALHALWVWNHASFGLPEIGYKPMFSIVLAISLIRSRLRAPMRSDEDEDIQAATALIYLLWPVMVVIVGNIVKP